MSSLKPSDFSDAAFELGCDVATVKAICSVESKGKGFNPDGSVVTLFEGHIFYKYTSGKFAKSHPDLCYQRWTRQFYGKTVKQEKDRLNRAMSLDANAAMMSTSWGMFQIMGFNHVRCGYRNVSHFVKDMGLSERQQLIAFVKFVKSIGAADELQSKDWAGFARLYNGPRYAENRYDEKLSFAYLANL